MNSILSFDISSVCTGWSYFVDKKLIDFGTIQISKKFNLQEKLYIFKSNVVILLQVFNPDNIVIEETYLKNVKTLKTLMEFVGVANLTCFELLNKEPIFVSPNTVRSYFNLKTKEDVFIYIKNKYKVKLKKYDFENGNDIADSILQALYCREMLKESQNE